MYRQIVVGIDGSQTAGQALAQAIELAAGYGARLDIVSAYGQVPTRRPPEGQVPPDVSHEVGEREEVNMILSVAASLARESGVEATTEAIKGEAREAILDAAGRTGADLIVVGNRGMSGARRILGSVPNAISHHAPCSVMIVATTGYEADFRSVVCGGAVGTRGEDRMEPRRAAHPRCGRGAPPASWRTVTARKIGAGPLHRSAGLDVASRAC